MLTFEMLKVHGQQHSFTTDEWMFFRNSCSFWDSEWSREIWTPELKFMTIALNNGDIDLSYSLSVKVRNYAKFGPGLIIENMFEKRTLLALQGAVSIRKTVLPGMAIPMLKIRRPNGRLIFNMEIAILR